tara:strand:+ start:1229 stop:14104 length:12876 start_codon:yes stop_codon:yes gene_type:complete
MAETRIKFSSIVKNQLPTYVENEFPLISEFLKQYYISQEFKSAPYDLIQNMDQYIKLDEQTSLNHTVILGADIDEFDETITISVDSPQGTEGFPDSYGLLKINDEVITYTGKTATTFTGCIRGFSGVTSYRSDERQGDLVFSSTESAEHKKDDTIENLTCLFLKEFLTKVKRQFLPGLSERPLSSNVDQNLFIKHSKDFYSSKGTDKSHQILFQALYGVDVKVTRPKDFLFTPSNANNLVTSNFLVEPIKGDPSLLEGRTIFQTTESGGESYTPIYTTEEVSAGVGLTYYKLAFDGGYNRDSRVIGATYGEFKVTPKTRVIGNVATGSTSIDVDSTIGFPSSGELRVEYPNGLLSSVGIVSYTSKTITQFLGCTNITDNMVDGDSVSTLTYPFLKPNKDIEVRIGSVLSNFSKQDGIFNYKSGDKFAIKTLGIENDTFKFKNWLYNNPVKYSISKIELIDNVSPRSYKLTLRNENYLRLGDPVSMLSANGVDNFDATVSDISDSKIVTIKTSGILNITNEYYLQRKLRTVNSINFPGTGKFHANIQNVYKKKYSDSILVASNSLPSYYNQPLNADKTEIVFSGTFVGETLNIPAHGYFTGESVYYTPEKVTAEFNLGDGQTEDRTTVGSSLFGGDDGGEGVYFVYRVDDDNIKLAKSPANLYSQRYVSIETAATVTKNKFEPSNLALKSLESQKIYREVSTPINNDVEVETKTGTTGIFVNGVEILNYKSKDQIYTGKLESIEVSSPGFDFDVINPPELNITDPVGSGATGFLAINGSLRELQILDRGFDFTETPVVSITGGNGSNAKALVSTKLISHSREFFSDPQSDRVKLGAALSTIGFGTYHKFRNGEELIYKPGSQKAVGGLSTDATYFASVIDATTVKLHNNIGDALAGINTVTLSFHGIGKHTLECVKKKSIVDTVNVTDAGFGYENKKRSVISSGINTALNSITIDNHDYNSGEIIKYTAGSSAIGGLTDGSEYYVTVVDQNEFRLSQVGPSDNKNFFYKTEQYLNLTSSGSGTQFFNYPPISVTITGPVGIATVTGIEKSAYEATVQPIFRGEVTSVHLLDKGSGYGTADIINFNKPPSVSVSSGRNAQVKPVITADGRIVDIIVENVGSNYTSLPDLQINSSSGIGCVLTPILRNGFLYEVKIIEPGTGYVDGETEIEVISTETDVEFLPKLQSWRINLFEKLYENNKIKSDDIVISDGKFGLQCYSLYAPRALRQMLYSIDVTGKTLYGTPDLRLVNSQETEFTDHSPIIGWAYDGNPIYGPYGYSTRTGGVVTLMKSSYRLNTSRISGPPTSVYPLGFFVEDYTYYESNDDSYLDRNNGRYCVTPDFPNGTYAYFVTINENNVESSGAFKNYKLPKFPYVLGDKYYSTPIDFNFSNTSNQDDYAIEDNGWYRNTTPYNLREDGIDYPYIFSPNNLSQKGQIVSTSRGSVNSVEVKTSGTGYKVGDELVFSDADATGFGAAGRVASLKGKGVSSLLTSESTIDVDIFPSKKKGTYTLESSSPHNFNPLDIINVGAISTTSSKIEGSYKVGVTSESFSLVGVGTTGVALGAPAVTGIVTFLYVSDMLGSNVVPNDILGIGSERVRVLNVDRSNSRFRVLRAIDGTVGAVHTIGSRIYEDPRRFTINSGFKTAFEFNRNREIYFEPTETVGLGITAVGIGSVLSFSYFGLNSVAINTTSGANTLAVPLRSLYIKDHNLNTGDILTYSSNGGSGLVYNEFDSIGVAKTLSDGQQLFAAKISNNLIGIATVRVGLGTTGGFAGVGRTATTLFFTGIGTGNRHSFTTNYNQISAEAVKRTVTVTTEVNHGIRGEHSVVMDVNPSFATTHVVKYSDKHRRMMVGIETFSAAGVNTTTNTITISNHGYSSGDKVIHSSTTPCQGLENDEIYYVVKVDENNFKLADTYYNSTQLKPTTVGIASTSFGEFGLVNPSVTAYRSSSLVFDLSDSSLAFTQQATQYSAFRFNFYLDEDYTKTWETDGSSAGFSVVRNGKPGLSTESKVTVSIGKTTPDILYYRLDPISDSGLPIEKSEIISDDTVLRNNTILSNNSVYNGLRRVSIAGSNFFNFELTEVPESYSYVSTASSVSYTTDCTHTEGPIERVEVTSSGRNYTSLPEISSVTSIEGTGADLNAISKNIGIIEKVKLEDIGYDFPTDKTLQPSASLPQIIQVDSLAKISSVGITSGGRGYTSAPRLIFFDGKTGNQVNDLDATYSLGDPEVTILNNTRGINNTTPSILPVDNSNGIGISTVGFNTITNDVTVFLSVGFSDSFPFAVGDRVMVEKVVSTGATIKGYNSKDYDYKLFTLTDVTPNLGGIGSVTYNVSTDLDLDAGEVPGSFDSINSAGMITPEKFFPTFNIILETGDYLPGEKVKSGDKEGVAQSWDRTTKTLRVLSSDNFVTNDSIKGLTSELMGIASTVTSYEAYFETDVSSEIFSGNQTDSGYLNDRIQRLPDNDYYQNFSYALRSTVPFDTWKDTVSSINHSLGYKKFGDLQIEATNSEQLLTVGLTTALTDVTIVSNLDGYVDTNCVFDFDIAKENNLSYSDGTGRVLSDEILFNNKVLTDFTESSGNRVLSIDDISSQFNSNPRETAFTILGTFPLGDFRFRKYFTYLRDKRFTQERQGMIVDLIHDGSFGYINQYGRVETVYDQGDFDFAITGTDGELRFYPVNSSVNDYDVTTISYNLNDNYLSTGSTTVGGVLIDSGSAIVTAGSPQNIVSIGSEYHSLKVLVEIAPDVSNPSYGNTATFNSNEFEAQELNIVHDGTNVSILEFGKLTTSPGSAVGDIGFGTYRAHLDGANIKVDFYPGPGIPTTGVVNNIVVGLSSASSGISTLDMKHARLKSTNTIIASSGSPTENVIAEYPSHLSVGNDRYDAAYCMIQVQDTSNNRYEFLEYFVVDDHIEGQASGETFQTEFANIQTYAGLGTFSSKVITDAVGLAATTQVLFTPLPGINTKVHVYMNAMRIEDDTRDTIDLVNGTIETGFGSYTGTDRDIRRSFELKHKNDNIFKRDVACDSSAVVNLDANTIKVPNHFYVTGEQIEYAAPGIGSTGAISITSTTFPSTGITTTQIPRNGVFVVKVNDDTIKLARSAEDALKSVPVTLDFTSLGVGAAHTIISTNQNPKVLIAIDNLIQSPIVSTAVTSSLAQQVVSTDEQVVFTGIASFFGGDLIKIGSEIMKIEGIGIGATNNVKVRRGWMGTNIQSGLGTGTLITKIVGNYNIVENTINFIEAPYGNTPIGTTTNPDPDEYDWTGITTSSSFQGRSFQRTAAPNTSNETYYKNYIFDDISDQFNATKNVFTLKSGGSNVTGIANEGAIILINDTFQTPGDLNNYTLTESAGISSVSFVGTAQTITSDVGISSFPKGGIIVSVGSTGGFGYQPLVSAGGTAVVSTAGTITSVSIGNSGSGYRSGVQTSITVSAKLPDVSGSTFIPVGIASASEGHITSVAITTDRAFYIPRTISNVLYDNLTGLTTVTTSTAHGLSISESVTVGGIAFTCNYAGSGPVNVSNVGYSSITGIMTVTTSGPHNLSTTGQKSDVLLTGIGMTCDLDNGSSIHYYPRTTDPAYCGTPVLAVNSPTVFEVNVGTSTVATFYKTGGVSQPVLIAPRINNNSASGFDPASQGSEVLRIVNSTTFEINSGISTRKHFYARCGHVTKPIEIVIDDPISYSNVPLIYPTGATGIGTAATIDIVVGQGSSVVDFEIRNTGYGYGNTQTLTVAIGGATGIPTTSSFSSTNQFEIQIENVINDEFTGWSLGVIETLDDVTSYIDGSRIDFPLIRAGNPISINKSKGSKIELDHLLLVFVNEILQVPGKSYEFDGGSFITFTEPLKIGDTITINFYKGSGDDLDVVDVEVIETVKYGDEVTLNYDPEKGQKSYLQENPRTISTSISIDKVKTLPYFGPGTTRDTTLERPITWCRQTADKIINGQGVGKDRELYEPVINPTASIISPVGVGSTVVYVDRLRPLFDLNSENADSNFRNKIQNKVTISSSKVTVGSAATAVVSPAGTVASITINNGGVGYSTTPDVSVGIGSTTATATATITNGVVTGITVTDGGSGYTQSNPPLVLIGPPAQQTETCDVYSYSGDSGVVVGFGTTTIGSSNEIILEFHIPYNSELRNTNLVGSATTLSGISVGDYFTIFNSNVSVGATNGTLTSFDISNNVIGITTSYIDSVFQAKSVEVVSRSIGGISTNVVRVNSRITGISTIGFSSTTESFDSTSLTFDNSGLLTFAGGISTSNYLAEFSWGKVIVDARTKQIAHEAKTLNGFSGLSTSDILTRTRYLRFKKNTYTI